MSAKRTSRREAGDPGRLVQPDWLAEHLDDGDVRVVHVGHGRRVYNRGHVPGSVYSDLHTELALSGRLPETAEAERRALVPSREQTEALLRRWRGGEGDRVVFLDDAGQNRHAARGYWVLRLYGFPAERLHLLDGGIEAWRRAGRDTTDDVPEPDLADALRQPARLGEPDGAVIATYDDVAGWSRGAARSAAAPARLLDVRTAGEWTGADARARRAGHIPGARLRAFEDLLTPEGTLRPVAEMLSLIRASGAAPADIRAVYCQSGVRAALGWFVLHELAGFDEVKHYAASWEEWGNRDDSAIEAP